MKYLTITAMMVLASAAPIDAQTKSPAAPAAAAGTCVGLMNSYDLASKNMASNFASGLGDNSAPRATLKEMEDANSLSQAKIALDLMRDNHCPLPKQAPAAAWYMSAALSCATDRMKASGSDSPASCDRTKWTKQGQ